MKDLFPALENSTTKNQSISIFKKSRTN